MRVLAVALSATLCLSVFRRETGYSSSSLPTERTSCGKVLTPVSVNTAASLWHPTNRKQLGLGRNATGGYDDVDVLKAWSADECGGGWSKQLFHGTDPGYGKQIACNGFRPSTSGLFGPGIYLADDMEKAEQYAKRGSLDGDGQYYLGIVVCTRPGRVGRVYKSRQFNRTEPVKTIDGDCTVQKDGIAFKDSCGNEYDSLHAPKGRPNWIVRYDEFIYANPADVKVKYLIAYDRVRPRMPASLRAGVLLVSLTAGGIFDESVILLTQYGPSIYSFGLIVNKKKENGDRLGGPVPGPWTLGPASGDSGPVVDGVFLKEGRGEISGEKTYFGAARWGVGQLDGEVRRGTWGWLPATRELVDSADGSGFWREVRSRPDFQTFQSK